MSPKSNRSKEPRVLSPRQCEQILEGMSGKSPSGIRNRAMFTLLWRCGLRFREVTALRREHIDWHSSQITVPTFEEGTARKLPMDVSTHYALVSWTGQRTKLRQLYGVTEPSPIFMTIEKNNFGQALRYAYVRNMVVRVAKQVGIEDPITVESFRDSIGLEMRSAGYSLVTLARLLGDRSVMNRARYGDNALKDWRNDAPQGGHWKLMSWCCFQGQYLVPLTEDREAVPQVLWRRGELLGNVWRESGVQYEDLPREPNEATEEGGNIKALENKVDELTKLVQQLRSELKQSRGEKG